jgi:hypothetical protein
MCTIPCDKIDLIAYLEGQHPDSEIERHLKSCDHCRSRLAHYQLLTDALVALKEIASVIEDTENNTIVSDEPLPEKILKRVTVRKSNWQANQLNKVLRFQNVKDRKKQDEMTRRFFDSADDALPKAAFPDDLPGGHKSEEDESSE